MKIAVIGSGISGLGAAYILKNSHEVKLFEQNNRLGGHSNTVHVEEDGKQIPVDTGFIVCNPKNYPNFYTLLNKLNVKLKNSLMSFSVQNKKIGLEYNGTNLNTLFADRKNIFNINFVRMLFDIIKFNRSAKNYLSDYKNSAPDFTPIATLGTFVHIHHIQPYTLENYLYPMLAAIWSQNTKSPLNMDLYFCLSFLDNHCMLNIEDRPLWATVDGGSIKYVEKIKKYLGNSISLNSKVNRIEKSDDGVIVYSDELEKFDKVIIATHSDQAAELIPWHYCHEFLRQIPYTANSVCLHTDESILPSNKRAIAAWNYVVDDSALSKVTYNLSLLQKLATEKTYLVSLNQAEAIKPELIIQNFVYEHPLFGANGSLVQQQIDRAQGKDNIFFAGAYHGFGFHEDGLRSAINVCKNIDRDAVCKAGFI